MVSALSVAIELKIGEFDPERAGKPGPESMEQVMAGLRARLEGRQFSCFTKRIAILPEIRLLDNLKRFLLFCRFVFVLARPLPGKGSESRENMIQA
ncbi:MAG: hypothetical protein L3J03_01120 [Desulfobacterales bacterium]|nr:hypothetical protein [Desulfobacterales bacterium]